MDRREALRAVTALSIGAVAVGCDEIGRMRARPDRSPARSAGGSAAADPVRQVEDQGAAPVDYRSWPPYDVDWWDHNDPGLAAVVANTMKASDRLHRQPELRPRPGRSRRPRHWSSGYVVAAWRP